MDTISANLADVLDHVTVNEPQTSGNLQVFGLTWPCPNPLDYLTLDEALSADLLEISEIGKDGSVPSIQVRNKSDRRVLLIAGEQLLGCKQNRVLNITVMIPAKTEAAIPVSCVEAGRWHSQSRRFRAGAGTAHAKLRQMQCRSVRERYKGGAKGESDQQEVWREVDRKLHALHAVSPSAALNQVYDDHRPRLEAQREQLAPSADCDGAVFAINGKIVGADLFDRSQTMQSLWPKLIEGYLVDALEEPDDKHKPVAAQGVTKWLHRARAAKQHCFESAGIGKDLRIEGKQLTGAALLVDQTLVHLELFQDDGR